MKRDRDCVVLTIMWYKISLACIVQQDAEHVQNPKIPAHLDSDIGSVREAEAEPSLDTLVSERFRYPGSTTIHNAARLQKPMDIDRWCRWFLHLPSHQPGMVVSTVFEETCVFINGVGGCTTVIGSRHAGPAPNAPTTAPTSTHITPPPQSTTSTDVGPTSSPSSEPASPSLTRSVPPSTPPSNGSPTAVAPSQPPSANSSRASSSFSAVSLTGSQGTAASVTSTTVISMTGSTATTTDTNTSAAESLSTTSSTPTPSPSTSFLPLSPSYPSSPSGMPAGAIEGIATGVGVLLLALVAGLVRYTAKRRRLRPTVVVASTSAGSNARMPEATSTTRRALLLAVNDDSENLECRQRNSFGTLDTSTRSDRNGSMIVEASNFVPLSRSPLPRLLETVPFLPTTPVKRDRGAASTGTATGTALSPSSTEAAKGRQSPAEMGGGACRDCDTWNGDANQVGEDQGSGPTFRYETDGGIRLDGGPLDELRHAADDDQHTIATVITLPPPYSRY